MTWTVVCLLQKQGNLSLVSQNQYKNAQCVVNICNFKVLNIWIEKGGACWAAGVASCTAHGSCALQGTQRYSTCVCNTHTHTTHTLYLFNI